MAQNEFSDDVNLASGKTYKIDDVALALSDLSGTIDTAQIAADAIDGTKIADDAVDTEHLAAGAVDTTALAADAVDGTKIADDAVDTEHIANAAVEALQIANGAVDTAHLAAGAVTAAKLDHLGLEDLTDPDEDCLVGWDDSAGATAMVKLGTNLSMTGDSLNATGGDATTWDLAGDSGTPETVSDEETVTIAGGTGIVTSVAATNTVTVAIENGGVDYTQLADDAVIQSKIAAGAVHGTEISDNAITRTHLSDLCVGADEIDGSAVTTAKLNDDAVTNAKLADPNRRPIELTPEGFGLPTTNPPELASIETTTNKQIFNVLKFDQTTAESANRSIVIPNDYVSGSVFPVFALWTAESGATGGIVLEVGGVSLGDDDALDTDPLAASILELSDTRIADHDVHKTASGNLTITGAAAGELANIRIRRKVADAGDTLTGDLCLLFLYIGQPRTLVTT